MSLLFAAQSTSLAMNRNASADCLDDAIGMGEAWTVNLEAS